jgi:transcriptional regulator with XRE-family HTH domain
MGQNGKIAGKPSAEDESEKKLRRDLGDRIVKARTERDMSQIKLARKLGIERSRLSKWERGVHVPLLKQLAALARALRLSLDELIMGRGSSLKPATRETLKGMGRKGG